VDFITQVLGMADGKVYFILSLPYLKKGVDRWFPL